MVRPLQQNSQGSVVKDYSFRSPTGSTGTFYVGGYYDAPAANTTLTIGGTTTQTYGGSNHAHGAHAFCVASGAGGTDLVLTVSGTSVTDAGVRTGADSEVIVADTDTASTDEYFETAKKRVGQITYTLTGASGAFTFNYGLCKYEDLGNKNFGLTDIEVTGRAGAADTGFNIGLIHHKATGWTYSAAAFAPGPGFLYDMNTDYNTEVNLASGEYMAWKRANLTDSIQGGDSEGILFQIVTGANNAVESMNLHIGANI